MREGLNSMGLTKSWLCGKERSPLENKALQSLVDAEKRKKKDSDMLRQLVWFSPSCILHLCTYVRTCTYVLHCVCMYFVCVCMYTCSPS
jgi:hypothetical protein